MREKRLMSVEDGDCGICLEWGIRLVVDGKYVLFGYLNEGGGIRKWWEDGISWYSGWIL